MINLTDVITISGFHCIWILDLFIKERIKMLDIGYSIPLLTTQSVHDLWLQHMFVYFVSSIRHRHRHAPPATGCTFSKSLFWLSFLSVAPASAVRLLPAKPEADGRRKPSNEKCSLLEALDKLPKNESARLQQWNSKPLKQLYFILK